MCDFFKRCTSTTSKYKIVAPTIKYYAKSAITLFRGWS